MAENWQEALASLRVLVCIAKVDGTVSPSEQTLLTEAWEKLEPASQGITLKQLLTENLPLTQILPNITTPDAQRALYDAARSIAEQDGIHPSQQQLLDQIQTTFRPALTDVPPLNSSQSSAFNPDLQDSPYEALVSGIQAVTQRNRQARNLILDYALGAAVIGLIPIRGWLILQFVVIVVLIIKMRRDIGALWGFPKGHDILAFVGSWFGSVGALAIALMAWLTLLGIGVVIPYVDSLALAAAFATLVWAQGQMTNQFYISSSRMDQLAFQRSIQQPIQQPTQPRRRR